MAGTGPRPPRGKRRNMVELRGLPEVDDDGLPAPEVGSWALEKYRRVWYYDQIFSTGMKNEWDQLVYVDLYAGPGHARIRDTDTMVPGSPLLALMVDDPFTKYVFCEREQELLRALRIRVERLAPEADVDFVQGDVNEVVAQVEGALPPFGRNNTQLSFCFVDPFSVDLNFETIRRLGERRNMDFLILLALGMDANRNLNLYLDQNQDRIDRFLGDPNWREKWKEAESRGHRFIYFLASRYIDAMESIGYLPTSPGKMYQVRSDTRNLGLYYLAFFSKHERGHEFLEQVLHYTGEQLHLGL